MGSWSGVVVAAWWRDLTTGEGKKLQDSRSEQEEFTLFLGMRETPVCVCFFLLSTKGREIERCCFGRILLEVAGRVWTPLWAADGP